MSPGPDQEPLANLEALARACFGDLSAAEIKLLNNAPKGEVAVCGPNSNPNDPANDPAQAESWGPDRQIRPDLIRWLCVDRQVKEQVDPKGIRVYGARITEALDLDYVAVPFPLALWQCRLMDDLGLRGAETPQLNLAGTWLHSLRADGCTVKGDVFLRNRFRAEGEVRFLGAKIGGDLDCNGATFKNPFQPGVAGSGSALNAGRAIVKGGVFLGKGFSAEAEVRLLGAQIRGNLACSGGTFKNLPQPGEETTGDALCADGIRVDGDVFLGQGFSVEGYVRLLGAQIGGDLACDDGTFKNPPQPGKEATGYALSADRAVVRGGVFLSTGFSVEGDVRLLAAQIDGVLNCIGAMFCGALKAEGALIKGALFWRGLALPARAKLNLINASAGALCDDESSWPTHGNLWLDGFVYARISLGTRDAEKRLNWLSRQETFTPQPYRQLAKVLKDEGDDRGARQVLFEMEHRRREEEDHTFNQKVWSSILRRTIGYGYYPFEALKRLGGLALLGFLIFWGGYCAGSMVPTDKDAYTCFKKDFKKDRQLPPHYERFHASIYSLENSFPFIKLGQEDRWQPDPNPKRSTSHAGGWIARYTPCITFAGILRWFRWAQIILGWVLATLGIAAVTGLVRKE